MKKLNYTYFPNEIENLSHKRNINRKYYYLIISLSLLTIISLKTDIWYSVEHYKAPQEPKIDYTMEISTSTIQFIKSKEGFSSVAYKDGNRHSIGYGTKAIQGQTITKEQAEVEMKKMIAEKQMIIEKEAKEKGVKLEENQLTALVSLAYNAGEKYARHILEREAKGQVHKKDFTRIAYSGGKYMKGLESRRLEEWELYNY